MPSSSRLRQRLVDLECETWLWSDVPLECVVVLVKYLQVTHAEDGWHWPLKDRVVVLKPDAHKVPHMLFVVAKGGARV